MGIIKNILRDELGYNLRERLNVYTGVALGFIAPVAVTKFGISCLLYDTEQSLLNEAGAWAAAIAINVGISRGYSLFSQELSGFPLRKITQVGGWAGIYSAEKLKERRLAKVRRLEQTV